MQRKCKSQLFGWTYHLFGTFECSDGFYFKFSLLYQYIRSRPRWLTRYIFRKSAPNIFEKNIIQNYLKPLKCQKSLQYYLARLTGTFGLLSKYAYHRNFQTRDFSRFFVENSSLEVQEKVILLTTHRMILSYHQHITLRRFFKGKSFFSRIWCSRGLDHMQWYQNYQHNVICMSSKVT